MNSTLTPGRLIAGLLLSSLLLAGCGGSEDTKDPKPSPSTSSTSSKGDELVDERQARATEYLDYLVQFEGANGIPDDVLLGLGLDVCEWIDDGGSYIRAVDAGPIDYPEYFDQEARTDVAFSAVRTLCPENRLKGEENENS